MSHFTWQSWSSTRLDELLASFMGHWKRHRMEMKTLGRINVPKTDWYWYQTDLRWLLCLCYSVIKIKLLATSVDPPPIFLCYRQTSHWFSCSFNTNLNWRVGSKGKVVEVNHLWLQLFLLFTKSSSTGELQSHIGEPVCLRVPLLSSQLFLAALPLSPVQGVTDHWVHFSKGVARCQVWLAW